MNFTGTTMIGLPLFILFILVAFSVSGLGETDVNQTFYAYAQAANTGVDLFGNPMTLNDINGHPVCWYNQTSVHGENGLIIAADSNGYPPQEAAWQNSTSFYYLFYDTDGADPVFYSDLNGGVASRPTARVGPHWEGIKSFNLSDSWGWLALVAAITAVASFVGLKFFGSGESETSLKLLLSSTFFITVWTTLSVITYPLILEGGFFVFIFYFGLTGCYAVGLILSTGGS